MTNTVRHLGTLAAALAAAALLSDCGGSGGYGGGGSGGGGGILPVPGNLVITEVMANPATAGVEQSKEWFEVPNTSIYALQLDGMVVTVGASTFTVPAGVSIPSGGYFVFASSNVTADNAGLPRVDVVYGSAFTLSNTNLTLTLSMGATMLDSVSFSTSTDGASLTLAVSKQDVTSNDNIANWCTSTNTYGDGTQKGSPGSADAACP
jgi:lamin tail-like protein